MSKIVTIVGVGALGSHLVQFLRSEDVTLRVIDFDRVEYKNVKSQFHAKSNVGALKVNGLAKTVQFLYGMGIETFPHRLVEDNASVLLKGDLIIDCLDNGASRRLVQKVVREKDLACLHGALAADGTFGRVVWDKDFIIDDESGEGEATCENGEFLPFIAVTSAYLARSAQLYLRDGIKTGFSISPGSVFSI